MEKVKKIVEILDELKIKDIKIYNLEKNSPFFDYVIIGTSNTSRTSNAVISHIKKENIEYKKINDESLEWLLIDFGNIILHVFTEEFREFYRLDNLLMDKPQIDINNL